MLNDEPWTGGMHKKSKKGEYFESIHNTFSSPLLLLHKSSLITLLLALASRFHGNEMTVNLLHFFLLLFSSNVSFYTKDIAGEEFMLLTMSSIQKRKILCCSLYLIGFSLARLLVSLFIDAKNSCYVYILLPSLYRSLSPTISFSFIHSLTMSKQMSMDHSNENCSM